MEGLRTFKTSAGRWPRGARATEVAQQRVSVYQEP